MKSSTLSTELWQDRVLLMIDQHTKARELQEQLNSRLTACVEEYEANSAPFFRAMARRATKDWTKQEFILIRDNFLYRTMTTAASVARVVVAALLQSPPDVQTAAEITRGNLLDELGGNDWQVAHPRLLVDVFNNFGEVCFGLEPTSFREIESSPALVEFAPLFRSSQATAYIHGSYYYVLGASTAQEKVGTGMLESLYKCMFLPLADQHPSRFGHAALNYFFMHLDGTEQKHADVSLAAAVRNVKSENDIADFISGSQTFLTAQTTLWMQLEKALEK